MNIKRTMNITAAIIIVSFTLLIGFTLPLPWLICYLLAINIITFAYYGYDKIVAKTQINLWRVPEQTLHIITLIGGTPAALLAQKVMRHKTVKEEFRIIFWALIALQVAIIIGFIVYF